MFHFVYKVTNILNGKIYIGVHSTNNINDDYIGTGGKHYRNAIKKYGKENFKREILKYFDTKNEAFNYESEIVNEDFISRNDIYNEKLGGVGGWDYVNSLDIENCMKNPEIAKKVSESLKQTRSKNAELYNSISVENLKKASQKNIGSKWHYNVETGEEKKFFIGEPVESGWLPGRPSISKKMKGKESKNKGITLSESTKKKMRESWDSEKRKTQSERMKEKIKTENIDMGSFSRGKKTSEKTKEKQKNAAKRRWEKQKSALQNEDNVV